MAAAEGALYRAGCAAGSHSAWLVLQACDVVDDLMDGVDTSDDIHQQPPKEFLALCSVVSTSVREEGQQSFMDCVPQTPELMPETPPEALLPVWEFQPQTPPDLLLPLPPTPEGRTQHEPKTPEELFLNYYRVNQPYTPPGTPPPSPKGTPSCSPPSTPTSATAGDDVDCIDSVSVTSLSSIFTFTPSKRDQGMKDGLIEPEKNAIGADSMVTPKKHGAKRKLEVSEEEIKPGKNDAIACSQDFL